jgi:NTE family protein
MWGFWPQRPVRLGRVVAYAALLAGCSQIIGCSQVIHNDPVNQPLNVTAQEAGNLGRDVVTYYDDMVVALTFSGGGMRAAAFSYGVLKAFDETRVTTPASTSSLLDRIDFISGVSGGSILAAYYGLKKRKAMDDFRERFLLQNAEASLQTDINFLSLARGLQGGINDPSAFPRWLDDHLYEKATFRSLLFERRPRIWINASDVYNRTPFVFGRTAFSALCSDLANYPVSLAVAASAAVPVVFTPIVIQNYPGGCQVPLPDWVARVRADEDAPPLIKTYADALERYHSGEIKYVKLLDGGLVDNYGLAAFTLSRLASTTPYGPLEPEEAIKLRRLLFLVVDAGRAPSGSWAQTVAGPSGVDLITATSDTATNSGAVGSYSAFDDTMDDYRDQLIRWRCRLSAGERQRLGAPPNWNCKDVKFFIGRVAFDQLGPERAAALNGVETRLRLPTDQVDMLIAAGRDALKGNSTFRSFLESLSNAPPRKKPAKPEAKTSAFPQLIAPDAFAFAPR